MHVIGAVRPSHAAGARLAVRWMQVAAKGSLPRTAGTRATVCQIPRRPRTHPPQQLFACTAVSGLQHLVDSPLVLLEMPQDVLDSRGPVRAVVRFPSGRCLIGSYLAAHSSKRTRTEAWLEKLQGAYCLDGSRSHSDDDGRLSKASDTGQRRTLTFLIRHIRTDSIAPPRAGLFFSD